MKRLLVCLFLLAAVCLSATSAVAGYPGWYYHIIFDTKIVITFDGEIGKVSDYTVFLRRTDTSNWLEFTGTLPMTTSNQTIQFTDNLGPCDETLHVPHTANAQTVVAHWLDVDSYLYTNYAEQFLHFWEDGTWGPDCSADSDGDDWEVRNWYRTGLMSLPDLDLTVFPFSGAIHPKRSAEYFDRIKLVLDPQDPLYVTLRIKNIRIYLNNLKILDYAPITPLTYHQNDELVFTDAIYSTRVNYIRNAAMSSPGVDQITDLSNPPYDEGDLLPNGPYCSGNSCYNSILDLTADDLFQTWDYEYGSEWLTEDETGWYFPTPPSWCSEYTAYVIDQMTNYSTDPTISPSWNSTYSNYKHTMTVERMGDFFKGVNLYIHPDKPARADKRNWRWDDLYANVRPGYYTGHVHSTAKGEDKGSHSTFFLRWATCRKWVVIGQMAYAMIVPCKPSNPDVDENLEVLNEDLSPTFETINTACQAKFIAAGGNQSKGRVHIDQYNLYNMVDRPEECFPSRKNGRDGETPGDGMLWYSASKDFLDDLSLTDNGFGIVDAKTWSIKSSATTYSYKLPFTRVDPSGRIFVAGLHGNDDIMEFIQYGLWQLPNWDFTVDIGAAVTPGTNIERFNNQRMQIDADGNLFSLVRTSTQSLLLKINRNGELAWSIDLDKMLGVNFSPVAMVVNSLGNIIITGNVIDTDGNNLVLFSLDPNHDVQWTNVTAGASVENPTSSLTVDTNDSLYEAGTLNESGYNKFILSKYNVNGTGEWQYKFLHPDVSPVGNPVLTVNGRGEVYVAGFVNNDQDLDKTKGLALLKFKVDGSLAWYRFYFGDQAEILHNWPIDIGLDFDDNVYVMATINRDESLTGYLLLKYDTKGARQWTQIYDSGSRLYDQAVDMAVTGAGYAYITGVNEHAIDGNYDIGTVKYDPEGNLVWSQVYDGGGTTGEGDLPGSIDIDPAGNIVVTGLADTQDGLFWVVNRYNNDFWWRENGCDGCLIDNTCFQLGDLNPQSACQYCDIVNDSWGWTNLEDTASCDDGVFCNGQDFCQDGICRHEGDPCPDNGLFCDGEESCNETEQSCDTTGFPCAEDEECLEESDECVPYADDDSADDDAVDDDTTGDDDDDDCGGCGGNASDWMERLF